MPLPPSLKRPLAAVEFAQPEALPMRLNTTTLFWGITGLFSFIANPLLRLLKRRDPVTVDILSVGNNKRRIIESSDRVIESTNESSTSSMPGSWPEAEGHAATPRRAPRTPSPRSKKSKSHDAYSNKPPSKFNSTYSATSLIISPKEGIQQVKDAVPMVDSPVAQASKTHIPTANLTKASFPEIHVPVAHISMVNVPLANLPANLPVVDQPIAKEVDNDIEMTDAPPLPKRKKAVSFGTTGDGQIVTSRSDAALLNTFTGKEHSAMYQSLPPKYFDAAKGIREKNPYHSWRSPNKLKRHEKYEKFIDDVPSPQSRFANIGDKTPDKKQPIPDPVIQASLNAALGFWNNDIVDPETGLKPILPKRLREVKTAMAIEYARIRKIEELEKARIRAIKEEEARIEQAKMDEEARLQKIKDDEAANIFKVVVFDPPQEDVDAVHNALAQPKDQIIGPNELTRHDLGTLLPQHGRDSPKAWLNDQIVNTTMSLMMDFAQEMVGYDKKTSLKPAPYHAFNSAWFATMEKDRLSHEHSFSRWGRRKGVKLIGKDILQAKKIFFPVCDGGHWTVVVVYPQRKHIEYLDSFGNKGDRYTKPIRRWLAHELADEWFEYEWEDIYFRSGKQDNARDCGVFVIMNSWAALRDLQPGGTVCQRDMPTARWLIASILLNHGFHTKYEFPMNETYGTNDWKEYYPIWYEEGREKLVDVCPFVKNPNWWANLPST
ncbi:cysteine proteinase [Tothia fuscella]|uniref:Cysteine proteinase n=1 Tax=Tothia fuscella TaxID=1048955 RepID=A0A9P4U0M8_9PEZI|nr:cysteine proteinase [Tothia fuscella]